MKRVLSIKHFISLIEDAKKNNQCTYTNCYLFSDVINKYIGQKRMFWIGVGAGIAFLYREEKFYNLYYYINLKDDIKFNEIDRPVVINLVHLDSKLHCEFLEIVNRWVKCGFINYKTYKQMILKADPDKLMPSKSFVLDSAEYELKYAEYEYSEEIQSLWTSALDVFSIALPTKEELAHYINEKHIRCIVKKDESKVVAVLYYFIKKSICTLNHIVVGKEYRRRGFGLALVKDCIENEAKDCTRYYLWVDEKNFSSINLYKCAGFSFTGKVTTQLLLNN